MGGITDVFLPPSLEQWVFDWFAQQPPIKATASSSCWTSTSLRILVACRLIDESPKAGSRCRAVAAEALLPI